MAEFSAAELFVVEEEGEIDYNETLIASYWSNSSFEEEDDETLIQPPIFTPETLDLAFADPIPDSSFRVAAYDSESDTDPFPFPYPSRDPELCWDCLHIDDDDEDDAIEDWEDLEERSRTIAIDDLEDNWGIAIVPQIEEDDDDNELEFDFMDPSDYDVIFGHFAEHDSVIRGGPPPAAKSAVAGIPSVTIVAGEECAVCKDVMEGTARKLPCSHCYHGDCIFPWLAMRNTCPVCRFELPTDNPEYENQRADDGRYGFSLLHAL